MIRSRLLASGHYLPEQILTNQDLESMVDTTHEWIVQRTGIYQRHIAAKEQKTSDMAIAAAKEALEKSGLLASDIDGVIVATATPDRAFPSVAVAVQNALGTGTGPCYDMQAACSGFVYALATADSLIKNRLAKRLIVIGAEKFSKLLDWNDRRTCVLFGDGAGAVILEGHEGNGTTEDQGLLTAHLNANGAHQDHLYVDAKSGHVNMNGQEVFKFAVSSMAKMVSETMKSVELGTADIDWLVPHQANIRILEATAKKINLPMDKVIVTLNKHGNTSAASIPLALYQGLADNRIKRGDLILFEALGGGFTWGSALLRY